MVLIKRNNVQICTRRHRLAHCVYGITGLSQLTAIHQHGIAILKRRVVLIRRCCTEVDLNLRHGAAVPLIRTNSTFRVFARSHHRLHQGSTTGKLETSGLFTSRLQKSPEATDSPPPTQQLPQGFLSRDSNRVAIEQKGFWSGCHQEPDPADPRLRNGDLSPPPAIGTAETHSADSGW